jgi:hypothetical protein
MPAIINGDVMNFKSSAFLGLVLFCTAIPANADDVSKVDWMNAMSTALPTYFCQSNQYFRQCFQVTQIECEETAFSATRICLQKYTEIIPAVLTQPEDGMHWGSIIGSCAGEAYEVTFQKRRINSIECNDPNNWQ